MGAKAIRLSFAVAGAVALVGVLVPFPGFPLLATVALAAGQLWASRSPASWGRALGFLALGVAFTAAQQATVPDLPFHPDVPLLIAAVAVLPILLLIKERRKATIYVLIALTVGLFFSALDRYGISAFHRGLIVTKWAVGGLPHVAWTDVAKEAFGPRAAYGPLGDGEAYEVLESTDGPFGEIELLSTPLGDMWTPVVGRESVVLISTELTERDEYQMDDLRIQPGDVVIDCGAHIGLYTKFALQQGAGLVIAFEPDPENFALLSRNLEEEAAQGRVRLVQAGVWDENDTLAFHHSNVNPAGHGFFGRGDDETLIENVPVMPLDDFIAEQGIEQVDWIKMDIEGAESRALEGASSLLARSQPRLAICTYHRFEDAEIIPPVALSANPSYQISAKHIAADGTIRPKVLFFR